MVESVRFGEFFRQRRKVLGLTLREFCRRNGYDPGNISRLERGLTTPPKGNDLLESYAKALKLEPTSNEWHRFMDIAAAETGRIPRELRTSPRRQQRLSEVFRTLRTPSGPWRSRVNSRHLEEWANYLEARWRLPQLVRRLVHATVDDLERIEFPVGEAAERIGWDGITVRSGNNEFGNGFVPVGLCVWEMGVGSEYRKKAERDFDKRSKHPLGLNPAETSFVFITPRKWHKKIEWVEAKKRLGIWKDVRVYDSANLEEWLETAPGVDVWFARMIGLNPEGAGDVDGHWANLASLSDPPLNPGVFFATREQQVNALKKWLAGPSALLSFTVRSPAEVIDFFAAYLVSLDEVEKDAILARTIIVDKAEAWKALAISRRHLILITAPRLVIEPELVAEALRHRHHVLLWQHLSPSKPDENMIELPGVRRYDLEQALIASGFERARASDLARESGGSLAILKRRVSRLPSMIAPEWAQPPAALDLVPILLVGGWDDQSVADRSLIAKLSGRSYEEVLTVANRWATSEDPPLVRVRTRWRLISREDSWFLLARNISSHHLDSLEEAILEVLGEQDPRFLMPAGDRWKAALEKSSPKYSGRLREGLAETVALLGALSEKVAIQDPVGSAIRAERVVKNLLYADADWKRWASLDRYLPLLAEAAPEIILDALESDLRREEPQVPILFAQEEDPVFYDCAHAGLMWALESLLWKPEFLTRASLILAKLAELDPGGQWANRPDRSLRAVYLPWFPQTCASPSERIRALRIISRKVPDAGWGLLLNLLPTVHTVAFHTHRPMWRDWAANWTDEVTPDDYREQVDACARRLLELVSDDVNRWIALIENIAKLPSSYRDRSLELLGKLGAVIVDVSERSMVSNKIRQVLNSHRSFPNADWAMPSEVLDKMETALKTLEPEDAVARRLWLFQLHPQIVELEGDTWEEQTQKVDELRCQALVEILEKQGLPGILKLAESAEQTHVIGFVLAKTRLLDSDDEVLPELLVSASDKISTFAQGYVAGQFHARGWDWVNSMPLSEWSAAQAGLLMLAVTPSRKVWDIIERLGEDSLRFYWSQVSGIGGRLEKEDVEYAIAKLLMCGRPWTAIHVLGMALHGNSSIDSLTVMRTLELVLQTQAENGCGDKPGDSAYEIQRFFRHLQGDKAIDTHRLAALEWEYLGFLDGYGAEPQTLHRRLGSDPDFFADLLRAVYPSRKGSGQAHENPTDGQKARAENGFRLLMSWKALPGLQKDGKVDDARLLNWVDEARKLCKANGHLEVCDSKIGEIFACSPMEADGSWPCTAVRDVIEEVVSDVLLRGFETGIFNKRGFYSKTPGEGGDQERQLAKKFLEYADACDIEWPRTAAALRLVSKRYEEDARREDEEALDLY